MNTQNSGIIEFLEINILKLRPIVGCSKFPTRNLGELIDIIRNPFLKHNKGLICNASEFFSKYKVCR